MMSVFKLISFLFVVIAAGEESELLVGLKNDGNEIKGFGAVISPLSLLPVSLFMFCGVEFMIGSYVSVYGYSGS